MHPFTHRGTRILVALTVFAGIAAFSLLIGPGASADSPAAPAAQPTVAATALLQQWLDGYSGASDTTIDRIQPDTNYEGESLHLHCKDYTSLPEQQGVLVRFDLSSIPRNAQVQAATFSLKTYDRNITDDLVVSFHVLSRTWEANQATWDRPLVGQSWGAAGANDGWYDRRENWESYAVFDINKPPLAWNHWDITDAVQYWVEQPQWNHGAKLLAYIGMLRRVEYYAYSSEAANLADRPKMIITYTVDAADPTPTDVPPTPTQTPTRVPAGPLENVTFQQGLNGYYGAADTELNRRLPDINSSTSISLHLRWQDKELNEATQQLEFVDRDEYNPILHFDVSSIPSNALVTAARLHLYPFYQSNSSYIIASSHMILRDWDVAQATWNQAANGLPWFEEGCGAPNWHYIWRNFNQTDFDYQVRETDWVDLNGANHWYSFDVQPMVQQWVWDSAANFGIIMKPHVDVNVGYTFYSSEAPDTSKRPKLVVEYWIPSDVPTATPTATGGATYTPTATRTATATTAMTASPTATQPATSTPTGTSTNSPTPTSTATATHTATPSPTSTPTPSPSASATHTTSPTQTETPTPTVTSTETPAPLQATFALDGAGDVPLDAGLAIEFPAAVMTYTVGFGFQPAIDFGVVWNQEATGATVTHSPFAPATQYGLSLSGGLALDGREIAPATWHFTTAYWRVRLPLVMK